MFDLDREFTDVVRPVLFVTFPSLSALYVWKTNRLRARGMEPDMTLKDREKILDEIRTLEEELTELEKALPPHSVKPAQLLRIEALEETIQAKKEQLTDLV